ncbi:hypothetical protein BDN70DRAFT_352132 [Pholiota conissans]|uniref:Uncharacterized protein n=1 Tax=Pholiota conissans TaxID=109636 RepID=A0A9P5YQ86_9AGAR|nr:hypothetical protein BDN70DRAFT_352132 [Pholiota conissans]
MMQMKAVIDVVLVIFEAGCSAAVITITILIPKYPIPPAPVLNNPGKICPNTSQSHSFCYPIYCRQMIITHLPLTTICCNTP